MSFLKNMTFARAMILVCLASSGGLGYQVWKKQEKIRDQGLSLEPGGRIERLVQEIQTLSKQYTQLHDKADDEALMTGKQNPISYITKIAGEDKVEIGRVDIKASERQLSTSMVDNNFSITPATKNVKYSKTNIANFLFTLEQKSRRVRVTELRIDALNRDGKTRIALEDYPADLYQFSCKLTSRQRRAVSQ